MSAKDLFLTILMALGLTLIIMGMPYIIYLLVLLGLKFPFFPITLSILLFGFIISANLLEDGVGKDIK